MSYHVLHEKNKWCDNQITLRKPFNIKRFSLCRCDVQYHCLKGFLAKPSQAKSHCRQVVYKLVRFFPEFFSSSSCLCTFFSVWSFLYTYIYIRSRVLFFQLLGLFLLLSLLYILSVFIHFFFSGSLDIYSSVLGGPLRPASQHGTGSRQHLQVLWSIQSAFDEHWDYLNSPTSLAFRPVNCHSFCFHDLGTHRKTD